MKSTTRDVYFKRLKQVVAFIADNLDKECDVNTLADIAAMSPYHFHRIYREMMKETVNATVRRMRLQQAAAQLIRTQAPVADIAKHYCYQSVEAFSRAFLQHHGETPSQYRQRCDELVIESPVFNTQKFLSEDNAMFEVKLIEFPTIDLIAYDHQGDYMDIGQVFERLFMFAGQHNVLNESTRSFGLYYDDPKSVALDALRSKACITVPDITVAEKDTDLSIVTIPAMTCAQLIFKGAYAELEKPYDYLFGSWLPNSGHEAADFPPFEEYLNDPKETPPAELLTAIHCLLK